MPKLKEFFIEESLMSEFNFDFFEHSPDLISLVVKNKNPLKLIPLKEDYKALELQYAIILGDIEVREPQDFNLSAIDGYLYVNKSSDDRLFRKLNEGVNLYTWIM